MEYEIRGNRGDTDGRGGCGSIVFYANGEPAFEVKVAPDGSQKDRELLFIEPINRVDGRLHSAFFGDRMVLIDVKKIVYDEDGRN